MLGGEVRGLTGLDHVGPGGDFAFTLSEREPLMSFGASGCSQAPSGCIWGPRAGRPRRRLLPWPRWEVKWTGPHGARSDPLLWGLLERDRGQANSHG